MHIRSTHHVAVSTPNLARLSAFYTEALGLPVIGGFPGHQITFIGAGDTAIELVEEDLSNGSIRHGGWDHVAFEVDDVDTAFAELSARGVLFHVPPEGFPPEAPTMRIAFFRDPDGNVIELIQPLADRYR